MTLSVSELLDRLSTARAVEPHFRSVRPSHLHFANGAAFSAFATQELAHCSGVTHEEAFNVRRLIAGFGLNLP
jgi:hypothetical protein